MLHIPRLVSMKEGATLAPFANLRIAADVKHAFVASRDKSPKKHVSVRYVSGVHNRLVFNAVLTLPSVDVPEH
jgi:hypothetical protein